MPPVATYNEALTIGCIIISVVDGSDYIGPHPFTPRCAVVVQLKMRLNGAYASELQTGRAT